MRTLVIDTATEACSVALFDDGECIGSYYREFARGHAEALVPMIAALPERGKAERIAVALGPGSFTGVRVGLAAARALTLAWQAELLGYPTLALVAAMAQREDDGPISVCMTAGHGQWFIGEADGAAQSLPPAEAAASARHAAVFGSQAEALVALRGWGTAHPLLPDARGFLLLPPAALTSVVTPHYGRGPDAKLPGISA